MKIEIRNEGIQKNIYVSICKTLTGNIYVHVSMNRKDNSHPERAETVEPNYYTQIEVVNVELGL